MSCPCDVTFFPQPVSIPAGLGATAFRTARALGIFADWRTSTLAAIGAQPALDAWRAREAHDLGLMLVEMGAYVFDVCDFYDALVAGDTFLKTALLPGAQRRLIALLGYLPRPAVAAEAWLAAEADGRRVITLPKGAAFSSGSFGAEAPQVFELDQATSIDPRINRLLVDRVPGDAITGNTLAAVLVEPGSVRVRVGEPVVLDFAGTLRPTRAASLVPVPRRGRTPAARLTFSPSVSVPGGATWSSLRILGSGGTRGLWKLGQIGGDTEAAINGSNVLLGSMASVHASDLVLFENGNALEARRVSSTIEEQRTLFATLSSTLKDTSNAVVGSVDSAPVKVAISRLSLNTPLGFAVADVTRIVVHHPLTVVAQVLVPLKETLADTDPIVIRGLIDPPRVQVSRLLLEDVHQEGVATSGAIDAVTQTASINQGEAWGTTLTAAVTLYGNVLAVSRGETVTDESLGTGDASRARQTFTLDKKPLTYLSAATASGMVSTLEVRVGGVRWQAVESFYGATDTDRVYIVRHDDEGETYVTFGGGARLPTGAPVTATYRFGAGRAVPPAGSIAQLSRPVPGLNSVRNVLPAFGGEDAESPAALAIYGPRSALLLGRAVSLADLEAAALVAGVSAARAMWRWDEAGLRAVAQIQYIGSPQLHDKIHARLRALSEPDAPISVVRALPQEATLAISLELHPDFLPAMVIADVCKALYEQVDLPGSGGLLRPEQLGPEGIVFLSRIAAAVMAVAGVAAMQSVSFDGTAFTQSGRRPAPGHYFDFGEPDTADSRLLINGVA